MTIQEEATADVCGTAETAALRPAATVLSASDMGGAWATRHSFARTMVRRAGARGWQVTKERLDLDAQARGRAVYRIDAEGQVLHFIAFSQTIQEDERTDRVIAKAWDVTAALVDGELTAEREEHLSRNVPLQEHGRPGPGAIILTRANRSARFFDYTVDRLSQGLQPEAERIGPSPYLLRSTAFYGNGKFGLREFAAFPDGHPLSVPYRSQMLTAWLLRELSIDMAEHAARAQSPATAVPLDREWSRYLGLGNATGLGMVPFVVNHPDILDAWCRMREEPLAATLATLHTPSDPELRQVAALLRHADRHLDEKDTLPTEPFLPAASLRAQLARLAGELDDFTRSGIGPTPILQRLHDTAAALGPEARGILASILTELRTDCDEAAERILTTGRDPVLDPRMTCRELAGLVERDYAWVRQHDFSDPSGTRYWWFSSQSNEEPRRAPRSDRPAGATEHCTDIARRIASLAADLRDADSGENVGAFLRAHPHHRSAAARVQECRAYTYGELRDSLTDQDFLPLSTQRFQLACYGMNNFSPQSTDWLRVTLFSGAPRPADVRDGSVHEDWLFPTAPRGGAA